MSRIENRTLLDLARALAFADDDHRHHRRSTIPGPGCCAGCGAESYTDYCPACTPSLDPRGNGRELAAHRAAGEFDAARQGRSCRPAEVW